MQVKIQNVRLAFPQLFEPQSFNGDGKETFGAILLIDPNAQAEIIATVNSAIDVVAKEKWGAKAEAVLKQLRATDKTALHDGDLKTSHAGFSGMMYVSARNAARPLVIDRDKTLLTAKDGRPYAGCYVNVSVDIWAQDNGFGKRVNATLRGVQFSKDGDAFSGSAPADVDEFDSVDDGEDIF